MRLWCAALLVAPLLSPGPLAADDHLVPPERIQSALSAAAEARAQDIATLQHTLSSPAAEKAAGRIGVDLGHLRGSLPALSDAEARDLATRAAALDSDHAAGILGTLFDLLLLVLLVLVIIIVAKKA